MNRLDLGMDLPDAVAGAAGHPAQHRVGAGRAGLPTRELTGLGHLFANNPEIGATTGIEFLDSGLPSPRRNVAAAWLSRTDTAGQLAQTPTFSHGPQIAKVIPLDAWMLT
jgi:hypothetical protein